MGSRGRRRTGGAGVTTAQEWQTRAQDFMTKMEHNPSVERARAFLEKVDKQYMPVVVAAWQERGLSLDFILQVTQSLRSRAT